MRERQRGRVKESDWEKELGFTMSLEDFVMRFECDIHKGKQKISYIGLQLDSVETRVLCGLVQFTQLLLLVSEKTWRLYVVAIFESPAIFIATRVSCCSSFMFRMPCIRMWLDLTLSNRIENCSVHKSRRRSPRKDRTLDLKRAKEEESYYRKWWSWVGRLLVCRAKWVS